MKRKIHRGDEGFYVGLRKEEMWAFESYLKKQMYAYQSGQTIEQRLGVNGQTAIDNYQSAMNNLIPALLIVNCQSPIELIFPKCFIDRFSAILHVQLFVNMMDMLPHGADGDGKLFCNFFIQ